MSEYLFGPNTDLVNGERVKQARLLNGFNQGTLAKKVGVTQAMIAHVEGGFKQPSDEVLLKIASATKLPVGYFRQTSPPELPAGSLLFRARSGVSRKALDQSHRRAQIVLEIAIGLAAKVKTIPPKIVPSEEPPRAAAAKLRNILGFDRSSPISHLIRPLEKQGAILLALPPDELTEAFAVWAHRWPVIAFAGQTSGDRLRLTIAHELGHLVMHKSLTSDAEIEREAYQFAAELLMPASGISTDFSKFGTNLQSIASLKLRWGVSMQALIRRAKDLEFISERQYHYLMQQMSAKGWRKQEPSNLSPQTEKPRLLRRMAELIYGDPIDYSTFAKDFNLRVELVNEILNRYATKSEVQSKLASRSAKVLPFLGK